MDRAEVTDFVTTLLAAGAVAVQAAILAALLAFLLSRVHAGARRPLDSTLEALRPLLLPAAAALALIATAGSLFYSEYSEFVPCGLCWYQRIAMYPLVIVLGIAAWRRAPNEALLYGLPLALIGAAIATWHIYIQENPDAETGLCTVGANVSCTTEWISELGYITIPALALTAFLGIAALVLAAARPARRSS